MHAGRILLKTSFEGPSLPPVPLAVVHIECERYPEATAKDGRPAGLRPRTRRAVSTKGAIVSPEKFAIVVRLFLFASGAIGFVLQRLLPEKYTTDASRGGQR